MSKSPSAENGSSNANRPGAGGAAEKSDAVVSIEETLRRENLTLRDRIRSLERQLSDAGDANYDLKQQIRQFRTVNDELRKIQGRV